MSPCPNTEYIPLWIWDLTVFFSGWINQVSKYIFWKYGSMEKLCFFVRVNELNLNSFIFKSKLSCQFCRNIFSFQQFPSVIFWKTIFYQQTQAQFYWLQTKINWLYNSFRAWKEIFPSLLLQCSCRLFLPAMSLCLPIRKTCGISGPYVLANW